MRVGDLIFAYPSSFIGKMIAKKTNSRFSHVALYIGNGEVIESDAFITTHRVKLLDTPYGKEGRYEVMTCRRLTAKQRIGIRKYALSKIGTRYDYIQIPAILIRLSTGIQLSWLDHPHRYICTELIYESYQYKGIDLLEGYPGGSVSPEELRWSERLEFTKEEIAYGT